MNEQEQEQFERQLRRFPPARLPERFMARILADKPCVQSQPEQRSRQRAGLPDWLGVLRWLAPAAAAAVIVGAFLMWPRAVRGPSVSAPVALKADGFQLEQKLVSSYDAVTELPGGEPVRVRVEQWRDKVILKDKDRGLVVEQSAPRYEVIPVRYETY